MKNEKTLLIPLIEWCKTHRGSKSAVQRALTRRGENVTWGMVSGWLHPDKRKRTEPKFSIGNLLLNIFQTELKPKKRKRFNAVEDRREDGLMEARELAAELKKGQKP